MSGAGASGGGEMPLGTVYSTDEYVVPSGRSVDASAQDATIVASFFTFCRVAYALLRLVIHPRRPHVQRTGPKEYPAMTVAETSPGTGSPPARHGAGRPAAFFDLDKTIIAKSSTLAFSRSFYAGGLISRGSVLRSAYAQFVYLVGGADHDQMEKMRDFL